MSRIVGVTHRERRFSTVLSESVAGSRGQICAGGTLSQERNVFTHRSVNMEDSEGSKSPCSHEAFGVTAAPFSPAVTNTVEFI